MTVVYVVVGVVGYLLVGFVFSAVVKAILDDVVVGLAAYAAVLWPLVVVGLGLWFLLKPAGKALCRLWCDLVRKLNPNAKDLP